jgi:hypothetical protein
LSFFILSLRSFALKGWILTFLALLAPWRQSAVPMTSKNPWKELGNRLGAAIPSLELNCGDLLDASVNFPPVQLVHVALVFEYVDPAK